MIDKRVARNPKEWVPEKVQESVSPGDKLREFRTLQKLSQKALGQKIGTLQGEVSQMEIGNSRIGLDRAVKIAHALHVHPAEILFPEIQIKETA